MTMLLLADVGTLTSEDHLLERICLKKKLAKEYTRKIYLMFEEQWAKSENLKNKVSKIVGSSTHYVVGTREEVLLDEGEVVVVDMSKAACVICSCSMFETKGILCKHGFHMMRMLQFDEVPDFYILKRWTIACLYIEPADSSCVEPHLSSSTFSLLSSKLFKLLEKARASPTLFDRLESVVTELVAADPEDSVNQDVASDMGSSDSDDESDCSVSASIRDPSRPMKTKGRPKEATRHLSHQEKAQEK